ncbi:MAG: methyltransferase domain-containing protein [Acidobacteria bacterium]|nr:methyltransferase domain-containing protein [Acidobacteriota bacterium]
MLEQFGQIDIYLFDQILKGRIPPGSRILDAGCGGGRNLVYFLQQGYDVYAADADPRALDQVRALARRLAPNLPETNLRLEPIERLSFPDAFADVVVCSAVLHFAADDAQFHAMLQALWRTLRPGGLFFARLASSIGIETQVRPLQGRRHLLPDGSERYLVDEALLTAQAERWDAKAADPLKTTVVQGLRSMTTWVLRKPAHPAG